LLQFGYSLLPSKLMLKFIPQCNNGVEHSETFKRWLSQEDPAPIRWLMPLLCHCVNSPGSEWFFSLRSRLLTKHVVLRWICHSNFVPSACDCFLFHFFTILWGCTKLWLDIPIQS
jgi:hypothetical protein